MNLPIFWYVGFGWVGLEKNPAVDPPRTAPYLINPKKEHSLILTYSCFINLNFLTVIGQVVCALDWLLQGLDDEEGGEVGGVGGDDDHGEEEPHTG